MAGCFMHWWPVEGCDFCNPPPPPPPPPPEPAADFIARMAREGERAADVTFALVGVQTWPLMWPPEREQQAPEPEPVDDELFDGCDGTCCPCCYCRECGGCQCVCLGDCVGVDVGETVGQFIEELFS